MTTGAGVPSDAAGRWTRAARWAPSTVQATSADVPAGTAQGATTGVGVAAAADVGSIRVVGVVEDEDVAAPHPASATLNATSAATSRRMRPPRTDWPGAARGPRRPADDSRRHHGPFAARPRRP